MMTPRLVVTDFDGTIFSEFMSPPVPFVMQIVLRELQQREAYWVVATGRDLSGILQIMERAQLILQPDWIVTVEREIYRKEDGNFVGLNPWNSICSTKHAQLFERIRADVPELIREINAKCKVTIYADEYSPICIVGSNNQEADVAYGILEDYAKSVPELTVVRNDVYMRLAHSDFNKGTAVAHIMALLGLTPDVVFVAGDHYNDLPMLSKHLARWLAAPANAIEEVKAHVLAQGGYVSPYFYGLGTYDALTKCLGLTQPR